MNISNYFCRLCTMAMLVMLANMPLHAQTVLQPQTTRLDVSNQMQLWVDDTRQQTAPQVAALPQAEWQRLQGPMSLGFTNSVVWLRFDYDTQHSEPQTQWVLELEQPLMQHASLHWRDAHGQWQHQMGTRSDATTPSQYNYRRPVFNLPNEHAGAQQVWLRLQTQTSMSSAFLVWQHQAFASNRTLESFLWGLVFGSYVFVILFYAMYTYWTRNRLHLFYTFYILGNLSAAWVTGNWLGAIGLQVTTPTVVIVMGIIICWINFLGVLFNMRLLRLDDTKPLLARTLIGLTATIGVVGSVAVVLGHYNTVIPWVQSSTIALIAVNVYLGVSELIKRNPMAPLFLWSFSVFYAGIVVRYLRNMGWLEPSFWTEHSYQIGSFVHMVIMSVGIFSSYNRLQRERNDALALADAEANQREQQAEFLGLVSHELRTPLTIVSTATDNMTQQAKLDDASKERLGKIQRAVERMRNIIEGYLNAERLTGPAAKEHKQRVDAFLITRQCVKAAAEKQAHPVHLKQTGEGHFQLHGDALQIQVAIDNLLNNALSHSVPDAPVEVVLHTEPDFLTLSVTNQGEPIDPRDLPHLFERFYRGRNAKHRTGSGLGLHLVQMVASIHHGHVLAENLPSGHCRFTLVLGRAGG